MLISLAEKADLEQIVAIANDAAKNTTANFATSPESLESWAAAFDSSSVVYPWLVARSSDGVVGFAKASSHRTRGAYAWTAEVSVYVRPDHQARGLGSALYRVLIPMLRDQGYMLLIAGITSPNPSSERLHSAVGFVQTGIFPRVGWKFGGWHDVSWWVLELQPKEKPPGPIRPVHEVAKSHL